MIVLVFDSVFFSINIYTRLADPIDKFFESRERKSSRPFTDLDDAELPLFKGRCCSDNILVNSHQYLFESYLFANHR